MEQLTNEELLGELRRRKVKAFYNFVEAFNALTALDVKITNGLDTDLCIDEFRGTEEDFNFGFKVEYFEK